MSATRVLVRLAVVSAIAATVFATSAATTAHAAEGELRVNLNGLDSSIRAGDRGDGFSVRLENRSKRLITGIRLVFQAHLQGLTVDGVRLTRVGGSLAGHDVGNGTIQFNDPASFDLTQRNSRFDSRNIPFGIQFTSAAPNGQAQVSVEAYVGQERFGGASDAVNVRGGNQTPTPTPEPTVEATSAEGQPNISLSAIAAAPTGGDGDSGGVPVFLYIMGAILVAMGGVILWLLLRGRAAQSEEAATGGYGPAQPYRPSHAAPTQVYPPRPAPPRPTQPPNPTAVMPVYRDPQPPPPGIDPWREPPSDFDPFNPR